MRIEMVLAEGSLSADVRVAREARALLAGAHRIFVPCRQNPGQPLEESWRGIERVKTLRQPFAVAQKLLFYLLLRDLRWEAHLHDFARRHALEALHVHDLPRAASVLRVGWSLGLPVVLDLHEDWPAMLVDVNKWFRSWWIKRWFMGQRRWRAYEARCVRAVDRVVVVVDAFRERLVASAGVPSTKFVVVGNTIDIAGLVQCYVVLLSSSKTEKGLGLECPSCHYGQPSVLGRRFAGQPDAVGCLTTAT